MNDKHEANRRRWDAASPTYAAMHDQLGGWKLAARDPTAGFAPEELALLGAVRGKRACVLGSGDNLAAFALAGMGADVTSVDISAPQLEVARTRAASLGLRVHFVRADVSDLSDLHEASFDIVHTGRHVAMWVTDLRAYYREAVRILKPGGLFLATEYHPIRRVFDSRSTDLRIKTRYLDRGPFFQAVREDLFASGAGHLPSYESPWTTADLLKAMLDPGCDLIAFEEVGDAKEFWETPPFDGLPQLVLLAARKCAPTSR